MSKNLQTTSSQQLQKRAQDTQNCESSVEKKIRFDEDNLRLTHHPIEKDYGLISIPESKTPYPRQYDPLEANDLRKRLLEVLKRANSRISQCDESFVMEYNIQSPAPSLAEQYANDDEKRRSEFLKKRKQFYQSEYTIAKQKSMSLEIPEPGPSIGNNWRIRENMEQLSPDSVPSILKTFIIDNRSVPQDLLVNRETLLEILKQQRHY